MKYFLITMFVFTFSVACLRFITSTTAAAEILGAILFTAAMIQAAGAAICQRLEDLIAQQKPEKAKSQDDARELKFSGSFSGGGPE